MKIRFYFSLITALLFALNSNAQIPNAGFENWGSNGNPVVGGQTTHQGCSPLLQKHLMLIQEAGQLKIVVSMPISLIVVSWLIDIFLAPR